VIFTTLGASVVSFEVRDKKGRPTNVVAGFDNIRQYANPKAIYFGAAKGIGRCKTGKPQRIKYHE
jgi:galactose mutarotase-like enzyme